MNYIQLACLGDLVRHQENSKGLFLVKMAQLKDADADQTVMDVTDGYFFIAKNFF